MAKFSAASALLLLLGGCDGSPSEGMVTITSYGEAFIEEGIPADAMDDGWEVSFDNFEVKVDNVALGGQELRNPSAVDLTKKSDGQGQELGTLLVPTGTYDSADYEITRIAIEGFAKKGSAEKTFSWVFTGTTSYRDCEVTTKVSTDKDARFEITVHADHLFMDSLASEEPQFLFGSLADADTDEDGEITPSELKQADIGAYDPGSAGGDIDNLWLWLEALSRTVGHANGEGHCHAHGD